MLVAATLYGGSSGSIGGCSGAGHGGDGGPGLRCHPLRSSGFMLGTVVRAEGVCELGVYLGRSGSRGG